MEEKIISNMTELSEAAEQKFKDIVNNNVTENPEGPNKINEPNTELPATGSIPDKSVTVDNPFKTDAGILGDNAKLVNPEVKEPTPDTPQEKAVSGVTDEVAAIYVDEKISDAGDGTDNFEAAIKKTEEELDKALEDSEGGAPTFSANGSDSSMDGSSDSGDKEDTGSSDKTTEDEGGEGDVPPSEDDTNDEEIEEKYDETDEKDDDSDDEEFNEGKENDETEYKSVTPAPSADTIIDKVDKFTTVDGEKLKDTLPPVVEGTLNGETKEVSTENPTKDIVDKENAQTGTIGPADGASEIMEIQKELNILGDSINEGSSGDTIGSDSNIGDTGDTSGDKIPDEIGSESDEGDNLEDEDKKDEAPVVEEEIKDEVKDEGETPTEGPSNATSDEVGDIHEPPKIVENATGEGSDKIETDIDLAGSEFEKNVKEFDNIVKLENTENLGEDYTKESNLITGGLDEMAAHAESVRAAMKEMGCAGFEGAMINANTNLAGMEAATSTRDTFDPNGQLFEDIFKNFPK